MQISLYSTQIIPSHPSLKQYAGLEVIVGLLAKYFSENGHDTHLFATRQSYFEDGQKGHLYAVGDPGKVNPDEAWKAYWNNLQTKQVLKDADIVLDASWGYYPYSVHGELKHVAHCHHGPDPGFKTKPPVDKPNLIAVSHNHAKRLTEMSGGVTFRGVENGIDLANYPFKKEKEDYYLWLSRIYAPKGIHRFIDICNKMQVKGLVCGGSFGDDMTYVNQIKKMINDSQYVTTVGKLGPESVSPDGQKGVGISHEEKVKLYQNAKAVVIPSIERLPIINQPGHFLQFIEPFGLIGIEANACLPENEVVFSDYFPVKIKDVNEGDIVNSKIEQSVVLKKYKRQYHGKLIKIKPQGLLPVSFTEGHPILVCNGKNIKKQRLSNNDKRFRGKIPDELDIEIKWKRVRDVSVGDYVIIPRDEPIKEQKKIELKKYIKRNTCKIDYKELAINEEIAYLLGWYLAEGCSNERNGAIEFNLNETDDCNAIVKTLKKYFGNPKIIAMKGIKRIITRNAPFCRWLLNEFGHGAPNKRIPRWIIDSDEKIGLKFLEGYIKGDGCVSKHHNAMHIQIKTSSVNIAHTLVFLFAKMGIAPCISHIKRENKEYIMMGRTVHQRDAYNIRIFGKELEKLIPNYKHNCIDKRNHLVFDDKILIPISKIEKSDFDGEVYNLSTTDMTFLTPFVVHNCGTPFIGLPSGGWQETVTHGLNGFFANSDEEFMYYMKRIDEIKPENCRKVAEHFSYQRMGNEYLKLFNEIINNRGW